ncbi:hypothetical protein HY492_03065 [Candidatus Woesearchaeota archaeon]|nr:hypothetical protein [Candidatus Woesearchaeota archaeon]
MIGISPEEARQGRQFGVQHVNDCGKLEFIVTDSLFNRFANKLLHQSQAPKKVTYVPPVVPDKELDRPKYIVQAWELSAVGIHVDEARAGNVIGVQPIDRAFYVSSRIEDLVHRATIDKQPYGPNAAAIKQQRHQDRMNGNGHHEEDE